MVKYQIFPMLIVGLLGCSPTPTDVALPELELVAARAPVPEIPSLPLATATEGERPQLVQSECGGGVREVRNALAHGSQIISVGPLTNIVWSEEEYVSELGRWRYLIGRSTAEVEGVVHEVTVRSVVEYQHGQVRVESPQRGSSVVELADAPGSHLALGHPTERGWEITHFLGADGALEFRLPDGSTCAPEELAQTDLRTPTPTEAL